MKKIQIIFLLILLSQNSFGLGLCCIEPTNEEKYGMSLHVNFDNELNTRNQELAKKLKKDAPDKLIEIILKIDQSKSDEINEIFLITYDNLLYSQSIPIQFKKDKKNILECRFYLTEDLLKHSIVQVHKNYNLVTKESLLFHYEIILNKYITSTPKE